MPILQKGSQEIPPACLVDSSFAFPGPRWDSLITYDFMPHKEVYCTDGKLSI